MRLMNSIKSSTECLWVSLSQFWYALSAYNSLKFFVSSSVICVSKEEGLNPINKRIQPFSTTILVMS